MRSANHGKLKLKMQFQDKIQKNLEKEKDRVERAEEQRQYQELFQDRLEVPETRVQFEIVTGKGTITTSGKSVHGLDTAFSTDLQKGDFIVITNPELQTKEERSICLILSNKSILLDQPFLQNQTQFGPYQMRKKPIIKQAQDLQTQYVKRLDQIQRTKRIHKEKKTVEIRQKKGYWGYATKKYETSKDMTKQQLLDMRSKIVRDKHCW